MDIAFIENNYSISKKFGGNSTNLSSNLLLDVLESSTHQKQDLLFMGDNYSIFKKIANVQENKTDDDCKDLLSHHDVPQENIAFIGNNYSICRKIDNAQNRADEIISDNFLFEQNESKDIDFDNALSLVSRNTENSSGISKFNAWFNDSTSEVVVKTDISLKNKQLANFAKSVIDDEEAALTAEEIEEENRKFSHFFEKVLPLEQIADSEMNDDLLPKDCEEDKVDITKTENILVKAIVDNEEQRKISFNNAVELHKNNLLDSIINVQESGDFNLIQETLLKDNPPCVKEDLTISAMQKLNAENLANPSSTSSTIQNMSIVEVREDEQVGTQSIEEMQQALLRLHLQTARNTAQIEENILLQKLKIAEIELKTKELEWNNMQKK